MMKKNKNDEIPPSNLNFSSSFKSGILAYKLYIILIISAGYKAIKNSMYDLKVVVSIPCFFKK